jgi:hypothetical protein
VRLSTLFICELPNFFCKLTLFNLLTPGAYGDVMRVKILFNKQDTALIQFADAQHAQTGKSPLFVKTQMN